MRFLTHVFAFLLAGSLAASAVTIEVDGRPLAAEPAPVNQNGRILVPLRAIFSALGAQVGYQHGQVSAHKGARNIELTLNQSQARVDGQAVLLESPAQLINGATYVPLRFVAQALGARVEWQANRQAVVVASAEGSLPQVFEASRELKRLAVGNQAGVLKVWDRAGQEVAYYRGLDDRSVARLSAADQRAILAELGINGQVDQAARQLMSDYTRLPKRETLALLGVMNSLDSGAIGVETATRIRGFLVDKMQHDSQVANRRQAVLALAVGSNVDETTARAVTDFYAGSENLWETFPVQQFFEYQATNLRQQAGFASLVHRVGQVNSLYRDNILGYLNQ
ncbi:MAG: copper amine oxidase N-terminal domain-containing protein [Vulcanimicrobiota bacterium]